MSGIPRPPRPNGPPADEDMGWLGPYRVLRELGEGGMGIVFEGEDPVLHRRVALKVIKPELAVIEDIRKRFLREARATAALNNEHVVPVYQVGEAVFDGKGSVLFLAMPLLRGESLESFLLRGERLPLREAVRVAQEVADGLSAAHESGLIHRDIKPANVFLEGERRRVRLLDFGLARGASEEIRLTQTGMVIGTPAYMAPEQANGSASEASDLYSLGCILYETVTGIRPFRGETILGLLTSIATEPPRAPADLNPAVPVELSDLILSLLSKQPEDRPGPARIVSDWLADCMAALPVDPSSVPRVAAPVLQDSTAATIPPVVVNRNSSHGQTPAPSLRSSGSMDRTALVRPTASPNSARVPPRPTSSPALPPLPTPPPARQTTAESHTLPRLPRPTSPPPRDTSQTHWGPVVLGLLLVVGVVGLQFFVLPERQTGSPAPATRTDSPDLVVDPAGGTGSYRTIAEAIAAAAAKPRGRVRIKAGDYAENLVLTKGVELVGPESGVATLRPRSADAPAVLASEGISELAFLTFAGGSVNQPAIVVRGGNASVSLSYCRVSEGGGTGVLVEGGGKATFQECRVYGNKGAGVLVRSSGEVTLRSTQVHANRDGLEVRGAKAQAEGGTTFKSSQDAGVVAVDKAAVVLAGCKFESNAKADIRASNNSTVKASPMPTGKREADGTSKIE